ncbi:MAG: hypothetical protein ABSC64_02730 [Candidatus Korobacteraceae bacterium]|jgi:hypothetical protein
MRLRKTVRLNGVNYEIDAEKITRLASRLEPKGIDKYWVKIQGRRLPPKQVVSELLNVPLVDFTTMDACRILAAVGFQVHSANDKPEPVRVQSEALLQEYLRSHGLTDIEVEPAIENTSSRPDYRLRADGAEVLFDVEEFSAKPEDGRVRGGACNPYGPIREKLSAARRKFKDMERHCCCLVLQNQEKPRVGLNWQIVTGAMINDLGFPSPTDKAGRVDGSKPEAGAPGQGETRQHSAITPENTIISAIIVIDRYAIGEKRFRLFVHEREQELDRELSVEEYLQSVEQSAGTERDLSLNRVRVRVHENPYATVPLDRRLFRGPFDERYGVVESPNRFGQVWIGGGVAEFEEKSAAAKLLSRS